MIKTKMLSIREYVHQLDWNNICIIHDNARIIELDGSVSEKAFIPLADCYKEEELFDSTIFVGEFNNITIGFVAFDKNEITWLYVDPLYFRNGFGRKLLEFALKNAKKPARVTVLNNNVRAIRLYKSHGFKVVEEKKGKIPLTDIEAIGLKMEQTS
jgi:ribosomal protein S18 acetylase RimI-like enzyme